GPKAKGLDDLKAATVFVKVALGALRGSGSGFLVLSRGDTGYVVTNDHVARPRKAPGVPAGTPAEVTLVFHSGTPQERSARAEVTAADAEQDLAVLKVSGVPNLPRPID